jgi:hypothetical protein
MQRYANVGCFCNRCCKRDQRHKKVATMRVIR